MCVQVLSSKHVDIAVAVGCLLCMGERSAFSTFRSALPTFTKEFDKLEQIAVVGMSTASAWSNQATFLDECASVRVDAMWCKLLESLAVRADWKSLTRRDEAYAKCALVAHPAAHCPLQALFYRGLCVQVPHSVIAAKFQPELESSVALLLDVPP